MKLWFVTLVLNALGAHCSEIASSQEQTQSNITYIPNTFLVQLEPQSNGLLSPSAHFKRNTGSLNYRVRREFNNAKFFYGLSLTVTDGTNQTTLQQTIGVKNVWKIAVVPRPEPFYGAPMGHSGSNATVPHITGTSDVNSALKIGGVDKLHKIGVKGKGVKIAIIDSGVDYTHPSLGSGFGIGHKIAFGYDFVGDDFLGYNTPVPDDDPVVSCASGGHGTHVSGIIGMNDAPGQGFGLVGVAPEATLGMYRIFGCSGGAPDDIIVSAMIQAVNDGADIISMSLGQLVYWEQATFYPDLIQSIIDNGVAVIAAAGNDGAEGPFALSAPALSPSAIAVGSVENKLLTTVYTATTDNDQPLDYVSVMPLVEDAPITVFLLGTGVGGPINSTISDGCYFPAWTAAEALINDPDHTAILIALDGFCSINAYVSLLDTIGITRIIYYPVDPSSPIIMSEPGTTDTYTIISLDYDTSQQILADISNTPSGASFVLNFRDTRVHDKINTAGDAMDYFSSIGPTIEMTQKPQLSAPGGNILATWPVSAGGYAVLSGTSMATPFAAGCYALLKSEHPKLSISELTSLLQSTSTPINGLDSKILSSTAHQGSGLVNAYGAVVADSIVSPPDLSFRDSSTPASQSITIKNTSKFPKSYQVAHEGASYMRRFSDFTSGTVGQYLRFHLLSEAMYATAAIDSTSFTLKPGQSKTITVTVSPPQELRPESLPTYSGYFKISSGTSDYVVPYIGVPYSRYDANYIARNTSDIVGVDLPSVTNDTTHPGEVNIGEYSFAYLNGSFPDDWMFPLIEWYVTQPTNFLRLEAVPVNTSFVPTYYGFDTSAVIETHDPDLSLLPGFLGVPTYGILVQFGIGTVPVDAINVLAWIYPYTFDTFGWAYPWLSDEEGNNIIMTSGDYRPLLRVLRYGGNDTNPDDYQSWLGPIVRANVE